MLFQHQFALLLTANSFVFQVPFLSHKQSQEKAEVSKNASFENFDSHKNLWGAGIHTWVLFLSQKQSQEKAELSQNSGFETYDSSRNLWGAAIHTGKSSNSL